jgi:hypothetical protein
VGSVYSESDVSGGCKRRSRVGRFLHTVWRNIRRRPNALDSWRDEWPPDFEDALVPIGPPRTPLLADGVALPLPEPESWDVDGYGRPLSG